MMSSKSSASTSASVQLNRHQNPASQRATSAASIASQRPICSTDTNSSGLCPCAIDPGPQITVGTPSRASNNPPSVPKATLIVPFAPVSP
jgi:hypothetical protein